MAEYIFHNETVVAIDVERGEIENVLYRGQPITDGRIPIFCVKLRKRTGESYVLSSEDFRFVRFEQDIASYVSDCLDVDIRLQQQENGLICRANIKNKTSDLLEWIELMAFPCLKN